MERSGRVAMRRALVLAALLLAVGTPPATAAGKPGYPDRIAWSGLTWQIKSSRSPVGPGPCVFDRANVSVDAQGHLHLRIARNAAGAWTCAEIIGPTTHGFGTYTFTVGAPVDALDPNVVLGLFTWSDRAPAAHREIDIEFARWGRASDPTNAQYVVQPWDAADHLQRFTQPAVSPSTHRFTWRAGSVAWESRDAAGGLIAAYTYRGTDVPTSRDERVRLNLWLFTGAPPTDGRPVDVVVRSFAFQP